MPTTIPPLAEPYTAPPLSAKELQSALQLKGDSFYNLLTGLHERKLSCEQLMVLLDSLSQIVTSIDSIVLIKAVIRINWINQSSDFLNHFERFLENLVSANATYSIVVCKMLIFNMSGKSPLYFENEAESNERIHAFLQKILSLVPTGPSFILPILSRNVPHKSVPAKIHVSYTNSLIRMISYVPSLQNEILNLIMENIIRIDVYIQEKLEDLSEEQIENVQDMLFTMEEEEENEDSDSDIGVDRTIQANYQEMFIKLDELMLLVLNYIGNLSGEIKQYETESPLEKTFFALMDCFERLIVPTHRIKCAQFVLFYICSLDTKFSEHLLSFLLASLLSDNLSSVIGLSITAYMGSFVSRAKYIPISAVKKSLEILNQYCSRYIGKNDFNSSKLNPDTHATFYGAVQAILYIFCFKWKELCGTEPNQIGSFPAELAGFHLVLMSKLEPLKICSDLIVSEFAKLTNDLNIMYCYSLMQQKSEPAESRQKLDPFFPFDPMPLPQSSKLIKDLYADYEDSENEHEIELSSSLADTELESFKGLSLEIDGKFN